MSIVGYCPQRIAELAHKVQEAVDYLDATTCDHPGAAEAMTTVRSVRATLGEASMSSLSSILASTAMTEWKGVPPRTIAGMIAAFSRSLTVRGAGSARGFARPAGADRIAGQLTEAIEALIGGDPQALQTIEDLLAEHGDDPEVLARVLRSLGPEGFVDLLIALGYGWNAQAIDFKGDPEALADVFIAALEHVGTADGFGAGELAATFAGRSAGDGQYMLDLSPLRAFESVADSGHAPEGFDLAFAGAVIARERTSDAGIGTWVMDTRYGDNGDDVVTIALERLVDDPEAARALASDLGALEYLSTREYRDGYTAYWALLETATAGPDLRDPDNPPSDATWERASVIVSQATHWFAESPTYRQSAVSEEASVSAARVAGVHMLAISHSAVEGDVNYDGKDWTQLELPRSWDESLQGSSALVADLEPAGRDVLTQVAISSDAGIEALRADLNDFHRIRAVGTASMAEERLLTAADVEESMKESGRLEGHFVEQIGHHKEGQGAAKDRRITFWTDMLGTVGGRSIGAAPSPLSHLSAGASRFADMLSDDLAHYQDDEIRNAEMYAKQSAHDLTITFASALVDEGLLEPAAGAPPSMSPDDFDALPSNDQKDFLHVASEPHVGGPMRIDLTAVEDALKLQQMDFYKEIRPATGS